MSAFASARACLFQILKGREHQSSERADKRDAQVFLACGIEAQACRRQSERTRRATSDLCLKHFQLGSLAGAAHPLNNNAGALRITPFRRKRILECKNKCYFDFDFQYEYKL